MRKFQFAHYRRMVIIEAENKRDAFDKFQEKFGYYPANSQFIAELT